MEFYSKIDGNKKAYKLNNSTLGAIIGLTADGFRMAVKRQSLSDLEIREIENYLESLNKTEQEANIKEETDPFMDGLIDKLFSSPKFMSKIDNRIDAKNTEIAMLLFNQKLFDFEKLIQKTEKKNRKL